MIEEPPDETRRVERHELVDGALRQPLLGEIGRGHGAGGAQHVEFLLADALDQRDDREQLADAGAVHPDQRARRTRDLALPVALADARRILLAALEPVRDERRRERRRRRRQQAVDVQRERQALRHGRASPSQPIGEGIGARGCRVEGGLDRAPRRFERRAVGVRRHAHRIDRQPAHRGRTED